MLNKIIRLLGGIPKDEVLTEAVKHLYNTIGADDILKENNGVWTFKGKTLSDAMKKLLIAEAQGFFKSKLWEVLQNDIKYKSNQLMFEKSKTEQDLIAGKLWLFTLDSFNTRLKSLDRGTGRFNGDAR